MSETSASLFDQLRLAPDAAAWQRLVDLYTPLIRSWLRRHARLQDADDLVQEVLTVLVRKLPHFQRAPRVGAFRRWLRTITVNCLRDHWRAQRARPVATSNSDFLDMLGQLEDPESRLSCLWDQEHDRHVIQYLLRQIEVDFEATTWQAFRRVTIDGRDATEVAGELGLTVNAVFIAKSRVLRRLRLEGVGLID